MKQIVTITIIFISMCVKYSLAYTPSDNTQVYSVNDYIRTLYNFDSILQGKPYILYHMGFHGYLWCVVFRDSGKFQFIQGTTRTNPPSFVNCPFDTGLIVENNIRTLNWAFDSLPKQSKELSCKLRPEFYLYSCDFAVYDSTATITFETMGVCEYSGKDVENFELNKGNFHYLMDWMILRTMTDKLPFPSDTRSMKTTKNKKKRKNND